MEVLKTKTYGVVYVVYNYEFDMCKIGITTDMPQRLLNLMHGSGCDLNLLYTTPPILNYSSVEKTAHDFFKDKRRQYGEWFNMDGSKAAIFISKMIDSRDIHPICIMYKEGKTISELSSLYSVSRAYIIKILKNWNIYKRERSVIFKTDKIYKKNKSLTNSNVPAKYRRASKFKRIAENLYKHEIDSVYKTKVFKNGELIECFFTDEEKAFESLKN